MPYNYIPFLFLTLLLFHALSYISRLTMSKAEYIIIIKITACMYYYTIAWMIVVSKLKANITCAVIWSVCVIAVVVTAMHTSTFINICMKKIIPTSLHDSWIIVIILRGLYADVWVCIFHGIHAWAGALKVLSNDKLLLNIIFSCHTKMSLSMYKRVFPYLLNNKI